MDSDLAKLLSEARSLTDLPDPFAIVEEIATLKAKMNSTIDNFVSTNSRSDYSERSKGAIQLERIKLSVFDGSNILEWPHWWGLFNTAVNEEKTIGIIQKFTYLKQYLDGDAKLTIDKLETIELNYPKAIESLCKKYNDVEALKAAYYAKFDEISAADTPEGHRRNIENLQSITLNLTSLNVGMDQDLLKNRILRVFPFDLRFHVVKKLDKNNPPNVIDSILKYLDDRIKLYERCHLIDQSSPLSSNATATVSSETESKGTTATLVGGSTNDSTATKRTKRKAKKQGVNPRQPQQPEPPTVNSRQPFRNPSSNTRPRTNPVHRANALPNNAGCIFCGRNNHVSQDCERFNSWTLRKEFLDRNRRCLVCGSPEHRFDGCSMRFAACSKCGRNGHCTLMCFSYINDVNLRINQRPKYNPGNKIDSILINKNLVEEVYLETFLCKIRLGTSEEYLEARGIFDSGSSASYIDKNFASLICPSMKGRKFRSRVAVFGSSETRLIDTQELNIIISSVDKKISKEIRVRTSPNISSPNIRTSPDSKLVCNRLPSNLSYADKSIFSNKQEPLQILIGNDQLHKFFTNDQHKNLKFGPILRHSIFGWVPTGRHDIDDSFKSYDYRPTSVLFALQTETINKNRSSLPSELDNLNLNLEKLWNLETIGIKGTELDNFDDKMLNNFYKTTYVHNNRYVVQWPWKNKGTHIDTNFRMCVARLKSLVNNSSPELIQKYDLYIQEQLRNGVIEYAPLKSSNLTHYLPHRGILRNDKLRVVYDASAKTKAGKSLNDLLYRGPMILENLIGLLLHFRLHEIGITADIEKAFLQLELDSKDRDSVRFLWVKDLSLPLTTDNLIFFRFARVPFGVISSPALLNLVIQLLLSPNNDPENATWLNEIRDKFYVDNLVTSISDLNFASKIFVRLREKFLKASMNLRDWTSNSIEFLRSNNLPLIDASLPPISILGVNWNRYSDTLNIKTQKIDIDPIVTKRIALSFAASIYDPLGLLNPCVLKLRLFIQDCWKNKYDWNERLNSELTARWIKIINELVNISKISIPRRYFSRNLKNVQFSLNIFCDASKDAYACCAYLCFTDNDGNFGSSLCLSKMRVKPIDKQNTKGKHIICDDEAITIPSKTVESSLTIPRMELLGVLLGICSANFLRNQFKITLSNITVWTDSTIVLQWLFNDDTKPKFVENRISEIKKVPGVEIRHVPGFSNPADLGTRGLIPESLEKSSLWWEGPAWLGVRERWPSTPDTANITTTTTLSNITVPCKETYKGILTDEFERDRYKSSWQEIVYDFEKLIANTVDFENADSREKFKYLEKELIKELQKKYFDRDIRLLNKGLQATSSLELFLDKSNLIRCTGRINNARIPWDMICPIYLPRKSPLVIALVLHIHENYNHLGVDHLMGKVRERFWICKLRSLSKSTIKYCRDCRRVGGGSYRLPPTPPLPFIRVQEASPFTHTGTDLLGPVMIAEKPCRHTNVKEYIKVYVALFTCLVTRAVHLEVVDSLSGDDYLDALTRFTGRRDKPRTIISDNATNFQFVSKLVATKVEILTEKLDKYLMEHNIEWKFIPAYSPWQGGAYERLVALVKNCLKKSHGLKELDRKSFVTCLTEIENTINSRPLTYVAAEEIIRPLTPNNFLRLRPVEANNFLEINYKQLDSTDKNLRKIWDYTQKVVKAFWDVFYHQYLVTLRERHAASKKPPRNSVTFGPRIGDVVLIKEPSSPRGHWPCGKITFLDRRGAIAHVDQKGKTLIRSINLLYPIELAEPNNELEEKIGK